MKILLAFILSLFSLSTFAAEVSVGYGKMGYITQESISITGPSIYQPFRYVDMAPELGVSRFRKDDNTIDQLYLTPKLRWHVTTSFIIDGGIGVSMMNKGELGTKVYGSRFQFVDHAGFSYNFGSFIVGYRIQHISNAGIKKPNPGINSQQIILSIPIDP